jgi:hypothetical protein
MVDKTNVKTVERQMNKRSLENAKKLENTKKTPVITENIKTFVRLIKALSESTEVMNKAMDRKQTSINIGTE